ncbi:YncE family protein [Acinetobacter equi]|uniref:Uncharacterized protein n=1 Tax=Acinetobacter equi TaxID=1324350 RepID=A0A0N9V6J9_9GAMM|nr:beta-propeller fold lactonase family protein [Acinetobacter equi]ALH94850.1 hypothetical protein AOY20_04490 [Acinetobacter equi]
MKIKKHILALSILFVFINEPIVASQNIISEQDQNIIIDTEIEDNESLEYEYLRSEIERLYPQYIKYEEDSEYLRYVSEYKTRNVEGLYLFYAQNALNEYQLEIAQRKIRKLAPKTSKLDAKLYQDIKNIYDQLDKIESNIKAYLPFAQAILNTIEIDQPYPILSESEERIYGKGLRRMYADFKEMQDELEQLNQKIDHYADQLDQFSYIDSKKIVKEHANNVMQLNVSSLRIGQLLSTFLKADDIYKYTIIVIDEENESQQRVEKLKKYANTSINIEKVKNLIASIPVEKNNFEDGIEKYDTNLDKLHSNASRCGPLWRGEEPDSYDLKYMEMSKEEYLSLCELTKKNVHEVLTDKVFLEPVPFKAIEINDLYYLADFKSYGNDIYYTNEETNALYRLNLDTAKSEIIIQKQLEEDDSGCTHNMCRGVGAIDVVLSHDRKYAYVASLDYDQVAVIDLQKKEIIQTYQVERYPRKLLLDEKGEYLFVYNGVSNSISRIHLKSHEIKTAVLPVAYQQHFCRTIDMEFSEETNYLKILGDWSAKPYVFLDTKEMVFKNSVLEVPYKSLFQKKNFQWVVHKPYSYSALHKYGVYDIRLDKVIEDIVIQYEKSEDQSYVYNASPVLFGRLNNGTTYVVDEIYSIKYNSLIFPFLGIDEYSSSERGPYNLHLISDNEKIVFPLKYRPESIQLLDDNRIIVAYTENYGIDSFVENDSEKISDQEDQYYSNSSNKNIEIYDLNDQELRKISKRNESKALNEIYINFLKRNEYE